MKKTRTKTIIKNSKKLLENNCAAATTPGEMTFNQVLPRVETGPLKYLLRGLGRFFKGIPKVLKNKKLIIGLLVLSLLWLVLLILLALEINNPVLRGLSFLTFARGGTEGDILGMTGGLIGKALFAYFITSIVTLRKPFMGIKNGLKNLLQSLSPKKKHIYPQLFVGAGTALLFYNFLTGSVSLENSMIAIAAFLISLKALGSKSGFLRGFIMSILYKIKRDNIKRTSDITVIMTGWTLGFALGIPLSITNIGSIGYLIGTVFIAVSVIIKLISKNKKEVPIK